MAGCLRVVTIVSACLGCFLVLAALSGAAGFLGQAVFYGIPTTLFFLVSLARTCKSCSPGLGHWLPGEPKYWFSILVGGLIAGCAIGFNLPPILLLWSPTKVDSVTEVKGEPAALEFTNGLTPLLPPQIDTALDFVGAYDLLSGSAVTCYLVVGLIDFEPINLSAFAQNFSLSSGCKAEGSCSDPSVIRACFATIQTTCCGPRGAIFRSSPRIPFSMDLGEEIPQEAIDDFKSKNAIASAGYVHVEFHDFDEHITSKAEMILAFSLAGVGVTFILSLYFSVTETKALSKVAQQPQNKYEGGDSRRRKQRGEEDGYHSDTSYDY